MIAWTAIGYAMLKESEVKRSETDFDFEKKEAVNVNAFVQALVKAREERRKKKRGQPKPI